MNNEQINENQGTQKKSKLYLDRNLHIIFGITLMAVMGVSSITPAFPTIQKELNIPPQSVGLLVTVFTLPGVFLTLFLGILADRFGRKKVLVPSLFLFALAGSACAFVRDFDWLLVLRTLQGMGAASLGSLNATLIGDLFSEQERTAAMGYNSGVIGIATAAYPAIGGGLAMFGWYYPFMMPITGLFVGLFVLFYLKNPKVKQEDNLKEYFKDALENIMQAKVIILFLSGIVAFTILFGSLTYLPFLLEDRFSASPAEIGMILTTMAITGGIASSQLGRLTRRWSEKTMVKAAFILYGIGLVIVPFFHKMWLLVIPSLIVGFANGINIPSAVTLLIGISHMKHRAVFMSLNGMMFRIGQTIGPLMFGVILGLLTINWVFLVGSIIAILMLVLLLAFFP